MATLTHTAIVTRKIIRFGFYGIILLFVGRIILGVAISAYQKANPEPPPAPTVEFGRLPKIEFPKKDQPEFTYTLQTVDGELPQLPPQSKVYLIPRPSIHFFSLKEARSKSISLGYTGREEELNQTLYRFYHQSVPAYLEMSTATGFFTLSYDLNADSSPLTQQPLSEQVASAQVRSFLSAAGLLHPELAEGSTKTELLKVENGNLVRAISLSEAKAVKVNIVRKSYDKIPTVTLNPNEGNVWFIATGVRDPGKQIIAGKYNFLAINEKASATYPIKTSQEAWNELIAGGGYIANQGENKPGEQVVIREVYLANLDAASGSFLQPVVVFEGDREFVAYVPAITSEYYGQ